MTTVIDERMARIKEIVCENFELETDEITEESLFIQEHQADSLKLIDILGAIEMEYSITIDMEELPKMVNLKATYQVVAEAAGW